MSWLRLLACVWICGASAGCGDDPAAGNDGSAPGDGATAIDGGSSDRSPDLSPDRADGGTGVWVSGTYSNDQGQRDYWVYVPSGYQPATPVPLVVVLHGCTVTVDQQEAGTRYTALADTRTFLVVYPVQSSLANPGLCWNWFDSGNQQRGKGEPSLIAGITSTVMKTWSIDAKKVYVIGPSAGGAMSVILGATYPDLIAAIGVVAGCEYAGQRCGPTGGPDPATQGPLAYQAMTSFARPMPVIVFHGDADPVAAPINGQQVTAQWLSTNDYADDGLHNGSVSTTATSTATLQVPNGRSYDLSRYDDQAGALLIESFVVHGAGHAWPGGPASATFTDPTGPDATTLSYDFFLAHARP